MQNLCKRSYCRAPCGDKTLCPSCMKKAAARHSTWLAKRRKAGMCRSCANQTPHTVCDACMQRKSDEHKLVRLEAIVAYGGVCACCGEDHPEFLQFDHIDGKDGVADTRSASGKRQTGLLYLRLKKHGYPGGYQLLCANCNLAIGFYGYCPHRPEVVRPTVRQQRLAAEKNGS